MKIINKNVYSRLPPGAVAKANGGSVLMNTACCSGAVMGPSEVRQTDPDLSCPAAEALNDNNTDLSLV